MVSFWYSSKVCFERYIMWKYKLYVVYRATHTGLNTKRIHQKTAGGASHYSQRVKLYKIKMKNNFSSLSTGQMLAIYYTNKKSSISRWYGCWPEACLYCSTLSNESRS
uniref:Uncharacterized protein n=1 Tax=Morchella brunnea TaxID=1174671 RepID=A0A8K1I857_9PEZI|nr:hypothetical protein LK370_mgp206 [Morchella brunnea]UBU98497.1 hypothetical protein [Morchella brunnea]